MLIGLGDDAAAALAGVEVAEEGLPAGAILNGFLAATGHDDQGLVIGTIGVPTPANGHESAILFD